jgi:hypothetical protein
MSPIIYFDMDGVCVQFEAAVRALFAEMELPPPPAGVYNLFRGEAGQKVSQVIAASSQFWRGLKPYPEGVDAVRVAGDSAYILTSPGFEISATPKLEWCKEHLGLDHHRVILASEKRLLSRRGTLLLDDKLSNCNDFAGGGGLAYVVERPWSFDGGGEMSKNVTVVRPESLPFIVSDYLSSY